MATYFVDSTTGDDGNDGLTMDTAWETLSYAWGTGMGAGDTVWIRRLHSENNAAAHIAWSTHSTPAAPMRTIGWPRAEDTSISSATWTNGSTTVDLIVGLSMDREQHLGRYIKCPDDKRYMITKIVDANTILIDTPYSGSTVTGANGACVIEEDVDYDLAQTIDDSGWTITKATWNADADDLPQFTFTGAYYMYPTGINWQIDNIDVTAGTSWTIYSTYARHRKVRGCLFQSSANSTIVQLRFGSAHYERCVITGSVGGGGNQHGIVVNETDVYMKDVAIYTCGNTGIYGTYSTLTMDNVNVGVEGDCEDADLTMYYYGHWHGSNVKLGNANEEYDTNTGAMAFGSSIRIENYNKSIGSHKVFLPGANEMVTQAVVAGSGDPYKRTGGSDTVWECLFNDSDTTYGFANIPEALAVPIMVHEFDATTDRRKYRYYVQAEGAMTTNDIWMTVEYIDSYGDAVTEYTRTTKRSTQSISQRVDASDWSQYIEVDNVTPAVASKVRVRIYSTYYHATNKFYIDPLPEVTT